MHVETSRQIKWDLIDHLFCNFADFTNPIFEEYTEEEKEYALEVIRRMAKSLNVRNHVDL